MCQLVVRTLVSDCARQSVSRQSFNIQHFQLIPTKTTPITDDHPSPGELEQFHEFHRFLNLPTPICTKHHALAECAVFGGAQRAFWNSYWMIIHILGADLAAGW